MNLAKELKHPIFKTISKAADQLGVETYVIGGFVRDLILKRQEPKDIDFVCIGSGIKCRHHCCDSVVGSRLQ